MRKPIVWFSIGHPVNPTENAFNSKWSLPHQLVLGSINQGAIASDHLHISWHSTTYSVTHIIRCTLSADLKMVAHNCPLASTSFFIKCIYHRWFWIKLSQSNSNVRVQYLHSGSIVRRLHTPIIRLFATQWLGNGNHCLVWPSLNMPKSLLFIYNRSASRLDCFYFIRNVMRITLL